MSGLFVIDDSSYLSAYRTVERYIPLRELFLSGSTGLDQLLVSNFDPTVGMTVGTYELWRLANVGADDRFTLNFTQTAALAQITVMSIDGSPLQTPISINGVYVIEAGQRADLVIFPFAPGQANVSSLLTTPEFSNIPLQLLNVAVTGTAVTAPQAPTIDASSLVDLRTVAPGKSRLFQLSSAAGIYMINNKTYNENRTDVTVIPEMVEQWTVQNLDTNILHSFHVHQQPFQVVSRNGTNVTSVSYQDVVSVPPGTTVVLRVKFPISLAGKFVFHCHVLVHEDSGMMGVIELLSTTAPPTTSPVSTTASPTTGKQSTTTTATTTTTSASMAVIPTLTLLLAVALACIF